MKIEVINQKIDVYDSKIDESSQVSKSLKEMLQKSQQTNQMIMNHSPGVVKQNTNADKNMGEYNRVEDWNVLQKKREGLLRIEQLKKRVSETVNEIEDKEQSIKEARKHLLRNRQAFSEAEIQTLTRKSPSGETLGPSLKKVLSQKDSSLANLSLELEFEVQKGSHLTNKISSLEDSLKELRMATEAAADKLQREEGYNIEEGLKKDLGRYAEEIKVRNEAVDQLSRLD